MSNENENENETDHEYAGCPECGVFSVADEHLSIDYETGLAECPSCGESSFYNDWITE